VNVRPTEVERAHLVAVILGLLSGLALIPVYEGVEFWAKRVWNPLGGSVLRLVTFGLLACLAAGAAAGLVLLVPGYLLGIVPLSQNTVPYFIWSFVVGGLGCRAFIELRKRRSKTFR